MGRLSSLERATVQPTTFKAAFLGTYTNALNGREWDVKTKTFNRVNENLGGIAFVSNYRR